MFEYYITIPDDKEEFTLSIKLNLKNKGIQYKEISTKDAKILIAIFNSEIVKEEFELEFRTQFPFLF
ncbi:hypothetical protein [Flavobacterium chungangensis]|uniref:Uncharacterized protein n=1 Tax=Flavobacterium chungangensis TaxID=2708132 RepID=A0ABV8ZCL1_9FLAO